MTAVGPLVQRVPKADHLTVCPTDTDPMVLRPSRWNFAGYCVMCLGWHCTTKKCAHAYASSKWEICRYCDGSGYDTASEQDCNCIGGLADMTHSEWVNKPRSRPPRLNLAGWCIWCSQRWCDSTRCIELHHQIRWMVCHRCAGLGFDDRASEPCICTNGLVEAPR